MNSRTLVLLGLGHTNAHVVARWIKSPIPDCQLVCVSNFTHATYSGMLPGTLAGQLGIQEMQIDLKRLCQRAGADLVVDQVQQVDSPRSRIIFEEREPLDFDVLSVGVGSVPAGIESVADSPLVVPIKPMQTFLHRIDRSLSNPRQLGHRIAVVGGGVASVEIAFCLQQRLRIQDANHHHGISIVTANDRVASGMRNHSVDRIERLLNERAIRVLTRSPVSSADETGIVLEDGSKQEFDLVLWATGAAAPKVLQSIDVEKDARDFIATKATLQSRTNPRIFAVGDSGTMIDSPFPKAGVYAVRQSPLLWHNLQAILGDTELKAFEPQDDFLKLLNTGDGKALLEYGRLGTHRAWCLKLKTWIDRRFIRAFDA